MIHNSKMHGFLERITGSHRPITADFFLTDFCNERCSYCRYSNKTGAYMDFNSFALFAKRALELGVKGIILTGGGEPSVNPDFKKITSWLEENNISYGLNTNFVKYENIKPVFLKVSLDAGSSESYKKTRGVDNFDRVISNIKEYSAWKAINSPSTRLGVQCLATTPEAVVEFYEAVKDLNVDYIYFRPLENNKQIHTSVDVLNTIRTIAKFDKKVNSSYKFDLERYKPSFCIGHWTILTVNCKGDVPYCCHFPEDIVGNILDDDILEKLSSYSIDTKKCEIPCRLSGVNHYLENNNVEPDYCFV